MTRRANAYQICSHVVFIVMVLLLPRPGIGAQKSIKVLWLRLTQVLFVLPKARAANECPKHSQIINLKRTFGVEN